MRAPIAVLMLLGLTAGTASGGARDGGAPDAASGTGAAFSETRVLSYERSKCEAGDLDSCLWGQTRQQSEGERLALLERACQLGKRGCVSLAFGLAGGLPPVPPDVARAREMAEPLCAGATEIGEAGACVILAQITLDPARVPALLERACRLGWAGWRGHIATNYVLPGGFKVYDNCLDHDHLGKPVKQRPRRRK